MVIFCVSFGIYVVIAVRSLAFAPPLRRVGVVPKEKVFVIDLSDVKVS
jgi:hypothetical protein